MSTYTCDVSWMRAGAAFTDNKYSRVHRWRFDSGIEVRASAAPSVVPLPMSAADAVDPEEAFVAALSSCHMLTFLHLAQKAGFIVDSYEDHASGVLERIGPGKLAMTTVTLRPRVRFSGDTRPDAQQFDRLHHDAHEACFIANSVTTRIAFDARME